MKRLLAAVMYVVVGSAVAQTANVILYGRINLTELVGDSGSYGRDLAKSTTPAPSSQTLYRVSARTDRLGVRSGTETFGGGLKAIFQIESSIPITSVALAGDTYFDLRTGGGQGAFEPLLYTRYLPTGVEGSFKLSPPGVSARGSELRIANAIRYDSPRIGGFATSVREDGSGGNSPAVTTFQAGLNDAGDAWTYNITADWNFGGSFARRYRDVARFDIAGWEASSAVLGTGFTENGVEQAALYKLLIDSTRTFPPPVPLPAARVVAADTPPPIALDTSFGGDGEVIIRSADGSTPMRYFHHAIDAQDRVLVAYGVGRPDGSFIPTLLRLKPDGTLDPTFANGGVVVIPTTGQSTNPRTITVDIRGNIVVTGETYTATTVRPFVYFHYKTSAAGAPETYGTKLVEHTIPGKENSAFFKHIREPDGTISAVGVTYGAYPDTATMRPLYVEMEGPAGGLRALQFFHANFGHFVTVANPAEAAKLDSGETPGWARTQRFFWVYPLGTPGTVDVDRHFSVSFAKSSHVFAADPAESARIKQNKDWMFEGPVFGAILPVMGRCPGTLRPVTRIFNNGVTGAPNHEFTEDPLEIGAAVARGGSLEGSGPAAAVYCTE